MPDLCLVQVGRSGPVALDGHDGVDVGLAVDDLAGAGHLRWRRVAGQVRGGVAGRPARLKILTSTIVPKNEDVRKSSSSLILLSSTAT